MAARRRRKWIAIGGATAAVATGAWGALALATPTGLTVSQPVTKTAPHLTWGDSAGDATGYQVQRTGAACTGWPAGGSEVGAATSFDDTAITDGAYCYRVVGHYPGGDDAGAATATVLYDTTGPAVQLTNPVNGALVHGSLPIQASASDGAGSGLASLTVSVDGLINPGPSGLTWDTTHIGADGQAYTVRATATDALGNVSNAIATVTIDNSAPAAPVITAQSPVAGRPTLSWATHPNETYSVSRNGSVVDPTAMPPWTDPATLAPGTYQYVVRATDTAANSSASATTPIVVVPPSATAPRSVSANSPTNSAPHLTWQPPVTFAVTSWQIYRDGALLQALGDASANSFDDSGAAQGPHTYSVQALSGGTPGDMSSPVTVTYDTVAPALGSTSVVANPSGSVSINWPAADDPAPGSGIASYVVRRGSPAPSDSAGGTGICTVTPSDTDCVDSTAKNGTSYGYAVFAIDAAGNKARREGTVKALDTQSPDAVDNFKVLTFDRTYARLTWTVPAAKGADADIAGYRVIMLRPGAKTPLSPNDGTVVCRNDDPKDNICDALGLTTGKKVTFAVYALDEVPNYSPPMVVSMVPHSVDKKPPAKPTKVRLTHAGLTYTLKWVSPKDRDLSKFRVTLYDKEPAPKPSKGKVVGQGRVLHATFTLTPGKRVYVNLFALDVVGNFSRVTRLIVAPGSAVVPKSKKKKAVAGKTGTKPPAKTVKKPAPEKPIPVTVASKS
jgi:hypothetical protein